MAGRLIPVQVGEIELLVETVPVAGSEQTSKASEAAGRAVDAFQRAQDAIVNLAANRLTPSTRSSTTTRPTTSDRLTIFLRSW